MRDVADLADVSINTASRALNNKPDVHPATRARVLEAAERLDYVANALARGLRGKRSRSLGVVAADIANPFFSEVIRGIEEAAFARGYGIIVGNTSEDPRKERRLLRTLLDQQVSGVLLTPTQKDDTCLEMLSSEGIPFVLIARRFETASVHAHSVLNDDYVGAFQAVDYLIRSGCRPRFVSQRTEAHLERSPAASRVPKRLRAPGAPGRRRHDLHRRTHDVRGV